MGGQVHDTCPNGRKPDDDDDDDDECPFSSFADGCTSTDGKQGTDCYATMKLWQEPPTCKTGLVVVLSEKHADHGKGGTDTHYKCCKPKANGQSWDGQSFAGMVEPCDCGCYPQDDGFRPAHDQGGLSKTGATGGVYCASDSVQVSRQTPLPVRYPLSLLQGGPGYACGAGSALLPTGPIPIPCTRPGLGG